MKNTFLIILIGLLSNLTIAQDFKADLKKMHNAFKDASSISCKMKIDVYNNDKLYTTKRAHINKEKNNYMYSLDDRTMLLNHQYLLMVDKQNKIIVVNEVEEESIKEYIELNQTIFQDIDTLLKSYESWEYLGKKGKNKSYLFTLRSGVIKRAKITIDVSNYTMKNLIYYYDEGTDTKNRVLISFSGMSLKPNFTKSTFSEKKYIQKVKEEWVASIRYKDYEVIKADNNF